VRRELLRAGKERGLARLDALKGMLRYAPITTSIMLKAAELWAVARKRGRQSAADASLMPIMILVAQTSSNHSPFLRRSVKTPIPILLDPLQGRRS